MDRLKRFCVPALIAAPFLLAMLPVFAGGSVYREFSPPSTVETGANLVSPHAVSDVFNRVNVAYIDEAANVYTEAGFAQAPFPGENFSSQAVYGLGAWHPRVAVSGAGAVFLVHAYEDEEDEGVYYPKLHRRDNGTFEEIFDGEELQNYEGGTDRIRGDVSISGDSVCVVADTNIHMGLEGEWEIEAFYSANQGAPGSFTSPVRVNDTSGARHPAVVSEGSDVYAAWVAGGNIYFNRSTDRGESWVPGAEQQISSAGNAAGRRPGIAARDGYVFIVWQVGNNIFFSFSGDGGSSFANPERIAITDAAQAAPSIGAGSDFGFPHLYVSWTDMREGLPRIYFQEAVQDIDDPSRFIWGIDMDGDGSITGDEIGAAMRVSETAQGNEESSSVAVEDGGAVYVVWRDAAAGIMSARYLPDPVDPDAPEPPTGVEAVPGDSEVRLSWAASVSADVDYYLVYRASERGDWNQIDTAQADETSYTDTGVENASIYWYIMRAVDTQGNESRFSNDANATPQARAADRVRPAVPRNLRASPGDGKVTLRWNEVAAAERYHVYSRTDTASPYSFAGAMPAPGTQFFHRNLSDGVTYEYVVTAIDAKNNESADSVPAWATPGTGEYGLGDAPAPAPEGRGPVPVGPGGGCFIATAAYGSPLAEEISVLSGFRDAYLAKSSAGSSFVNAYYRFSPAVSEVVAGSAFLRFLARLHLAPVVRAAGLVL